MTQSLLQKYPVKIVGPGVVKNLPANLIPDNAFQDLNNVRLLNGVLSKVPGWTKFTAAALTGKILGIDQLFLDSGSDYLMIVTESHIYKWNTGTSVFDDLGSGLSGVITQPVSTEVAFNLFLLANSIDTVKKWDGSSGSFAALGGLTDVEVLDGTPPIIVTTAGCVRFFKNFIVLIDVTENGTRKPLRVRWCRLDLPENWKNDSSGNGEAGAADIGTTDWNLTAERLGNSLAIYKERSIWLMSYIGVPLIFDFREVITGLGAVGPRAVGNFGDEHFFVGNDDFYFFNGESIESVGEPVRQWFFTNAHPNYLNLTQVFIMEENNELLVAFASTASTDGTFDKALVYNWLEESWSIRDLTAMTALGYYRQTKDLAWSDDSGSWAAALGTWDERTFLTNAPINLLGDSGGYIYQIQGGDQNGAAVALSATSKLLDLGDANRYKRVMRIQLFLKIEGNYTLTVNIGTSDNVDDDVVYTTYTFNLQDTTNPFLEVDVTGRLFTFQFLQSGIDQDIGITGYTVYFIPRGPK